MNEKKARVIAFYLPQFHPVKENDEWWGKGFTEWTNVGKAKPLFKGHYQPRIPADLGYYDLRIPEVREAQAEMARGAGIEGFMYWHYWFGNGKQILERPFKEVLKSGNPDFPFCLGWANHSWTNHSWNSTTQWKSEKFIAEQLYPGKEDIINHFFSLLPAFLDNRYITIDGNPIFLIYDPLSLPNPRIFMEIWQNLAIKNGLNGIHFIGMASGWITNYQKILDLGFDSIQPNGQWNAERIVSGKYIKLIRHKIITKFGGIVLDKYNYRDIIEHLYTEFEYRDDCFPLILPQWDRSARSGRRAVIYHGSTPQLFEKNIKDALRLVKNKDSQHKIIFLKSWNEWAEGNYVEPDLKYGHSYLNVIKNSIIQNQV